MITPVVPLMVPLVSVTAPTVSEMVWMSKVPPFTVTRPVSSSMLAAPSCKVPTLTKVPPV